MSTISSSTSGPIALENLFYPDFYDENSLDLAGFSDWQALEQSRNYSDWQALEQSRNYSGLQAHEVHFRLYSGSINAAAIQTKPEGLTSLAGNPLYSLAPPLVDSK
ncbi:hypothetical protein [Microseira wollei]|uniref:Uncharacterized protein n=1 Tax=Microseira wollei NIES-4236 TaxID=2530354 RepID=A0AAV3XE55_9CYAN|nr:hypothetical protein [Microseira wollei]GET38395.1 hypothetical protein MiSe_31530 [Microseira wollei NIES-4236]